jgi:membrane associated rhomboid family serine protease
MIYDRPYMQDEFRPRQPPVLKWILLGTIGIFILQNIFELWFRQNPFLSQFFRNYFYLSPEHIANGYVWTLVTYAFFHSTREALPLHLLANMLIVFFIGRIILPVLGARRFTELYFGAAVVGGIVWLVAAYLAGNTIPVIGASGAAMGLLVCFACMYPNKPITILLFFIIPVTLKPKYIAFGLLAFDLFGFLFSELPGTGVTHTAHSAHLGGMLTGFLFYRFVHARPEPYRSSSGTNMELPAWFKKKSRRSEPTNYSVNITNRQNLKKEVDRILDKINSEGFGSLSEEEKRILDRAKDLLSR